MFKWNIEYEQVKPVWWMSWNWWYISCAFFFFFFFFFFFTQVWYCQGIRFLAGVLLLDVGEEKGFGRLVFLMYDLGIRQQYRPDMVSLQVSTWLGILTTRTCYENMRVLVVNKDTIWRSAGRIKGQVTPKYIFFLLPVVLFIHLDYLGVSCRVLEVLSVFQI